MDKTELTGYLCSGPLGLLCLMGLLLLTALACRTGAGGGEWQPNSASAPSYNAANLPPLLVQSEAGSGRIFTVNVSGGDSERPLTRATGLSPLLAGDYQMVGDILVGGDQFFGLTKGLASPNGLWIADPTANGLLLFRVDGAGSNLSADGRNPIWSPDGRWLAYQTNDGVWAVNVSVNLTPQQLSQTSREPLAWSRDNQKLLLRQGQTAVVLDTTTQQTTNLGGVNAGEIQGAPVWSPDGRTIYARYGNNGALDSGSAFGQPDAIQARLVAIAADGSRTDLRDLLPSGDDRGVSAFLLSPDGELIIARHFVCQTESSGLIPLLPTRQCSGALRLVETATGRYQTTAVQRLTGNMAWEQPLPPVNLADLPRPEMTGTTATRGDHSFWWPAAEPGRNPATAIPLGRPGTQGQIIRTVTAVAEGEEARNLAANADPPLLWPPAGYRYVAVQVQLSHATSGGSIFNVWSDLLLDDRLAAHASIAWLDMNGRGLTELRYSQAEPAAYWQLFILEETARPWLLVVEPGLVTNAADLYLRLDSALDSAAEWTLPATHVESLAANDVGVSQGARFGETAVSSEWQITLLNPPLEERPSRASGDILYLAEIAYTGPAPAERSLLTCLNLTAFQATGGALIAQSDILRTMPFHIFHRRVCFLPGGQYRGWLMVLSLETDEAVTFRFNPPRAIPFGERLFTALPASIETQDEE